MLCKLIDLLAICLIIRSIEIIEIRIIETTIDSLNIIDDFYSSNVSLIRLL